MIAREYVNQMKFIFLLGVAPSPLKEEQLLALCLQLVYRKCVKTQETR